MDLNATMVSKFFNKKSSGVNTSGSAKMQNQQSAEKLHKSIIKKSWKSKITIIFWRKYLWCSSCRYAVTK